MVEGRPAAERQRPIERRQREGPIEARAGRPADDAPRMEVEDDGQVEPALAGREIGEIRRPDVIGDRDCKLLLEQVGRDREGMSAVGRDPEPPASHTLEARGAQEPGGSLPPDRDPIVSKIAEDPRTPVGPVTAAMTRRDPHL
jgi:hypothetical protein